MTEEEDREHQGPDAPALDAGQVRDILTVKVREAVAGLLLVLAAAFFGGGITLGLTDVTAGVGAACGSAYSPADTTSNFELTDTGKDTCAREIDRQQSLALAFLVAGGVTLVGTGLAVAAVTRS
jgi:hypothetical protein